MTSRQRKLAYESQLFEQHTKAQEQERLLRLEVWTYLPLSAAATTLGGTVDSPLPPPAALFTRQQAEIEKQNRVQSLQEKMEIKRATEVKLQELELEAELQRDLVGPCGSYLDFAEHCDTP